MVCGGGVGECLHAWVITDKQPFVHYCAKNVALIEQTKETDFYIISPPPKAPVLNACISAPR